MTWRVVQGDCVEAMAAMDAESVDAVVTDPPYGIGFMGHQWDQPGEHGPVRSNGTPGVHGREAPREGVPSGQRRARNPAPSGFSTMTAEKRQKLGARAADRAQPGAMEAGRYDLSATANRRFQGWCELWAAEVLRVLKPGGHLLVFGGTRTYHRLAAGVEDAGFEIRDCITWMYGSGFPKSLNLDGDREGWGTALKPASEPIVVARKPLTGTVAGNVLEHGTGALNVDGTRIAGVVPQTVHGVASRQGEVYGKWREEPEPSTVNAAGRWPANVVLSHSEDCAQVDEELWACVPGCPVRMLDDQAGERVSGANPTRRNSDKFRTTYGDFEGQREIEPNRGAERGGASRFFYCAKASRAERNAGLDKFEATGRTFGHKRCAACGRQKVNVPGAECQCPEPREWVAVEDHSPARNSHPTVKPIDLMRWLVRLVTPPGGVVLDPFTGSGTTGCAVVLEGFEFVGVEREADYVAIAEARIGFFAEHGDEALRVVAAERVAERAREIVRSVGQDSLFDLLADG